MGYSNEPLKQKQTDKLFQKYVQDWTSILNTHAANRFGSIQPNLKFSACISIFSHLPDVAKLYMCGLLNDSQFVELTKASQAYYDEACHFAKQIENPENIEEVSPPSFEDVKDNLTDDLFHHPIMEDYLEIIDQIDWATKIYDMQNLNMESDWICFDDMPKPINVLYSDNLTETDAFMINTLLSIRNGCTYITPDQKIFFDALVNRFYDDTLSVLLDVPENELSIGTTDRATLAHSFFTSLFNSTGLVLTGTRENMMKEAVTLTRDMLASQPYDPDWTGALLSWYDNVTLPYLNSLEDRKGIRKITSKMINKPRSDLDQNCRE